MLKKLYKIFMAIQTKQPRDLTIGLSKACDNMESMNVAMTNLTHSA